MSYLSDFSGLFFPAYCSGCSDTLVRGEDSICLRCQLALSRTGMHDERGNRLEKLFWGRAEICEATAFLKMPRSGMVHHLIHELKYHDNQAIGNKLGRLFGTELKKSVSMCHFDFILPVPLHPKRLHHRGYNQCDCIADGMEISMGIPALKNNLVRIIYNESQTKMGRYARWKNVETIFTITEPQQLERKRVLLVDDVITTGSTIESCAQLLNTIPGLRLSVAALAMPLKS